MTNVDSTEQLEHHTHPESLTMSPATAEPVQDFPLLKLPAELRNRIYELAIEGKPRIASLRTSRLSSREFAFEYTVTFTAEYDTREPVLLSLCREIRREAKGMFGARRPCKVVLFACSFDYLEILYWERQLLRLFSRPETMTNASALETGLPNFAMWQRAIHWLRDTQAGFLHGGTDSEMETDWESNETSFICAIAQVARSPSRKPWDIVEEPYSSVNHLLREAQLSSEKDDWKQL